MIRQPTSRPTPPPWAALGDPAPAALAPWRVPLHWAAQIVAAVGHTFATPRPDDSHTSLTWDAAGSRFLGEPLRETPIRAALEVASLTLQVVDAAGVTQGAYALGDRTLDQGYAAIARLLEEASAGAIHGSLRRREYDMPAHPVADGAAFVGEPRSGFEELARWYGDAAVLLERTRLREPAASDVRCWPHHFDIAILIAVPRQGGADPGSIGLGMTPGDATYADPYWYVTPFPHADRPDPPPLPSGGRWRREGWFGAVLTGGDLVTAGSAAAQAEAAAAFVDAAIDAARDLIHAVPTSESAT